MHEVVIGALVQGGKVLLAKRSQTKLVYPGVWDLPGGVVEPGEWEVAALARELREELGVQIDPTATSLLARVLVGTLAGPARISAWLVQAWRGEPTNAAPEEHDAIRWFTIDELPPLQHEPVETPLTQALRQMPEQRLHASRVMAR